MRDDPNAVLKCQSARSSRSHKRCWFIQTAGRWPWKSESAKECVTTHLPNLLALKMDGAQAGRLMLGHRRRREAAMSRRARGSPTSDAAESAARAGMKRPPVQILVVVANIQMRTLKAEGEKGFTRFAIMRELVGPKR